MRENQQETGPARLSSRWDLPDLHVYTRYIRTEDRRKEAVFCVESNSLNWRSGCRTDTSIIRLDETDPSQPSSPIPTPFSPPRYGR